VNLKEKPTVKHYMERKRITKYLEILTQSDSIQS